ncbi:winged helix-turn-helix transcriptional regulator [Streptomyces sp. NPDC056835]|uniref:winged helix-turn-helix transcriptional regulator n=1 Tax=Streptomyces sp. NPDC056835 TaxID=3345956 RepID=UPI003695AE1F
MMSETSDAVTPTGLLADREREGSGGWCPLERALGVVGTRSAMLLVREGFYGARRFDQLARRAGITETVTAKRLRALVGIGVFERVPYREAGQRTRHEYVLTDMGRALFPVLASLMNWGDSYLADASGGISWTHSGCGAGIEPRVRCAEGHDVAIGETSAVATIATRRPDRAADRKPARDEAGREERQGES